MDNDKQNLANAMRAITETAPQRFFATRPTPCPYLEGKMERKVFTELTGPNADNLHHVLANNGFRRSQNIAYRPFCENCTSCVAIRVILSDFKLKKWMRRVVNRNADLVMTRCAPRVTEEQYSLFNRYLAERHANGGMADMTFDEYQSMVEDSAVTTEVVEFRNPEGELAAACLVDIMDDGLSLIYSFFAPERSALSTGSAIILSLIEDCRLNGSAYVYLGYWIEDSPTMAYKSRFQPIEALTTSGWTPLEG
jgi:leucyl-tRNA---protein transferase